MANFGYLKIEHGNKIAWVTFEVTDENLRLPAGEFCKRYMVPAIMQLQAELDDLGTVA